MFSLSCACAHTGHETSTHKKTLSTHKMFLPKWFLHIFHTYHSKFKRAVYFMSTASGRPQGGRRVRLMWTHVDKGRRVKNLIFCGHHKWMAPNFGKMFDKRNFMHADFNKLEGTFLGTFLHSLIPSHHSILSVRPIPQRYS